MTTTDKMCHYTECGLDDVYLMNGFKITPTPEGPHVSIKDIEGLHASIGGYLVKHKKNLSGKEIRYLRHEMLISQQMLANFLGVGWQSINRWENEKTKFPKSAESLLRLLYLEYTHPDNGPQIKKQLKRIADMEEEIKDGLRMRDTARGWEQATAA